MSEQAITSVVKKRDYIVVFEESGGKAYHTNLNHMPISLDINDAFPLQLTMASEIVDVYKDRWEGKIYSFKLVKELGEEVEAVDYKYLKHRLEELNSEVNQIKENW